MNLLARLLTRWSERRVERWFGSRLVLWAIFRFVAGSYDPRAGHGFEGCLVYELARDATGAPPAVWRIEVSGDRARPRRGACSEPKLTLSLGLVDFLRVGAGALDPAALILQGRGSFRGPLDLAVALPDMFGAARRRSDASGSRR